MKNNSFFIQGIMSLISHCIKSTESVDEKCRIKIKESAALIINYKYQKIFTLYQIYWLLFFLLLAVSARGQLYQEQNAQVFKGEFNGLNIIARGNSLKLFVAPEIKTEIPVFSNKLLRVMQKNSTEEVQLIVGAEEDEIQVITRPGAVSSSVLASITPSPTFPDKSQLPAKETSPLTTRVVSKHIFSKSFQQTLPDFPQLESSPALFLVNHTVLDQLATVVDLVSREPEYSFTLDSPIVLTEEPLINPTVIICAECELISSLMSTSTLPMPTPVVTEVEEGINETTYRLGGSFLTVSHDKSNVDTYPFTLHSASTSGEQLTASTVLADEAEPSIDITPTPAVTDIPDVEGSVASNSASVEVYVEGEGHYPNREVNRVVQESVPSFEEEGGAEGSDSEFIQSLFRVSLVKLRQKYLQGMSKAGSRISVTVD